MSRIVRQIEVEGKLLTALFDTGSLRSYVTSEASPGPNRKGRVITVGLGGQSRRLEDRCDFTALIDGLEMDVNAYVIPELGLIEQGRLDVIIGALTMEEWWIKLDPHNNELDLSGLRKGEFTEFPAW